VAALLALLEITLAEPGRPLGSYERAILARALYRTYAARGIEPDPATHGRPVPLMRDLLAALAGEPGDTAADLATRLERYVGGSLAGNFADSTRPTSPWTGGSPSSTSRPWSLSCAHSAST
jgi:hypothetical protein